MKNLHLAIDGGGTKTAACLIDETGIIYKTISVEGINPNKTSPQTLADRINQLATGLKDFNQNIKSIYAGVSGCMHVSNRQLIQQILFNAFNCKNILVEHDLKSALFSGTQGAPGIVLISGTGSIVYGLLPDNSEFRKGGRGIIFSDDGSGSSIGMMAVQTVLQSYDGLLPSTKLTKMLTDHLNLESPENLTQTMLKKPQLLSTLAPLVNEAASECDEIAICILKKAANHLSNLLDNSLRSQEVANSTLPIVLTGGIFRSMPIVYSEFTNSLSQYSNRFIVPSNAPLYGAAIACLKQVNVNSLPIFND